MYFYLSNIFWLLATYLLTPIFYLLIFLRRRNLKSPWRILVIPPVKIGDLVCSTPIFREIKKALPESYLGVVLLADSGRRITSYQLLKNNPYIDKIILPDKKRGTKIIGLLKLIKGIYQQKYNWSFTLSAGVAGKIIPFWSAIPYRAITTSKYDIKTSKILSFTANYKSEIKIGDLALRHHLSLLKFIGIEEFNEKKEIFTTIAERKEALRFLKNHQLNTEDFLIGIAVTAGNKLKEWFPEKFSQLADRLVRELKAKIIFIGGPNDKKAISFVRSMMKEKSVDSSQSLSLIELAAILKYLKVFISVDTGPLYMANAMGVPIVDIVGPFAIETQLSLEDENKFVQIIPKDLPCFPCSFVIKTARFCKEGHRQCVENISVDDVFEAVKRLSKKLYPG